jgi:O-antigen/teichoic acid export membrane protein
MQAAIVQKKRSFFADAAGYLPATVLPALFSLVAGYIFTRIFSPAQYGIFSLVIGVTGPLTTVLSEWIAQPVGRFYAEYAKRERIDEFKLVISRLLVYIQSFVFIGTIIAYIYSFYVLNSSRLSMLFLLGGLIISIQTILAVYTPLITSSMQIERYRTIVTLSSFFSVLFPYIIIRIFGNDIIFMLVGQLLSSLIALPLLVKSAGLTFLWPIQPMKLRQRHTIRRMLSYGIPMMIWFVASGLLAVEDRYFIQYFRDESEVGIYSINYGLITGLSAFITVPVIMAIGPILYRQWNDRNILGVERTISRMTSAYICLALISLGVVIISAKPLVDVLLGESFRSGFFIIVPVFIGRILWGLATIGHKTLELRENTITMVWGALLAAIVNFILNLIFIPRFGYGAAAYTTLISYAAYAVFTFFQARYRIRWIINFKEALIFLLIMLASLVITELTSFLYFSLPVIYGTALKIIVYLVFFAVFVFFFAKSAFVSFFLDSEG